MAFFGIVAILHQRLGMSLSSITAFSALLHEQLDMRAALAKTSIRIYLNQSDEGSWDISTEVQGPLSVAIDLEPVWHAVYQFVGVAVPAQRELALGLVSLPPSTTQEHKHGRMVR